MKCQKSISTSVTKVAAAAVLLGVSAFSIPARAGKVVIETPPIVRVTPPPPVITEKERHAELALRRARVAEKIGPNSVLILFSAEPRVYSNDVNYDYRQENNLYYLTNLKQKRATLVLLPGNKQTPEILFIPRRSPFLELWDGRMYSSAEAAKVSGIKEIWDAREFEPFV
ncbi:MAG: aminopeptidase P N-terminal domain-containing protein, partial [Pyrinomonadaceae bacterium]